MLHRGVLQLNKIFSDRKFDHATVNGDWEGEPYRNNPATADHCSVERVMLTYPPRFLFPYEIKKLYGWLTVAGSLLFFVRHAVKVPKPNHPIRSGEVGGDTHHPKSGSPIPPISPTHPNSPEWSATPISRFRVC